MHTRQAGSYMYLNLNYRTLVRTLRRLVVEDQEQRKQIVVFYQLSFVCLFVIYFM